MSAFAIRMIRGSIRSFLLLALLAGFAAGVGLIAWAMLAAAASIGLDTTSFSIAAGGLSIAIGLGLQSTIRNLAGGAVLLFEGKIRAGDFVRYGDVHGRVRRIGLHSSTIDAGDGSNLVIVNGRFVSEVCTSLAGIKSLCPVAIRFGVSYQADPELVGAIVRKAAGESPLVLKEPAPRVGFENFGAHALEFSLNGFAANPVDAVLIGSDLRTRILLALRQAGIEMPLPQHDVHLRDLDGLKQSLARVMAERDAKARGGGA